ncbi:MAG: HD-GYP domain-containing protein [Candidatus Hydrogenedentota bacterium]|nr:MAG: HD-GYP domain-containing protein [Candidatus Hydrogenedentota bacterium]
MKTILVSSLKPGMAFSKPVYIEPDNQLVGANEPISEADIERLKKWKIMEVQTEGEIVTAKPKAEPVYQDAKEKIEVETAQKDLAITVKSRTNFMDLLDKGDKTLREAYAAIASETPFQISRVRSLAEEIVSMLEETPNIFMFLYYHPGVESIYKHALHAAVYAAVLSNAVGFSTPKTIELTFAVLLMDVGMMLVPESVLNKSGKLTEEEMKKIHAHTLQGYQLLTQSAKIKNSLAVVALEHHEHFDGSGYPRHIKGKDMSDYTKVATIADSYAALLEAKAYRGAQLPYHAMKELLTLGIYRYDPIYLKAFLERMSMYPIGSVVQLSDNSVGLVVRSVAGKPMRPILLMLRDENGAVISSPVFIHLLYHKDKYITDALDPQKAGIHLERELEIIVENIG